MTLDHPQTTSQPIRDASTLLIVRHDLDRPQVLMGQRAENSVFMPGSVVFPGGAVEPSDKTIRFEHPLKKECRARLMLETQTVTPEELVGAAIRELWEETGLFLAQPTSSKEPPIVTSQDAAPPEQSEFHRTLHEKGFVLDARALTFFFRAITPPGHTRRFDARFFLADAGSLWGDIEDFSASDLELNGLGWLGIDDARKRNIPLVTDMVLAELKAHLETAHAISSIPYFHMGGDKNGISRLV